MATMKITIPKDHPAHKGLKVGDMVAMRGPVTAMGDEGAECEMDGCEKEKAPPKGKKKMTPLDYLRAKRRGETD